MNIEPILKLHKVSKSFATSSGALSILEEISLCVMPGEKVAIIGPSGSGKSTLLSLLGLLDTPTQGEICIDGEDISTLTENEMAKFRNENIGFIFQSFELISPFTVSENILAPLEIGNKKTSKESLTDILTEVKMLERADALPHTLSGGEKQRVSIARALIHKPKLILADEPTGSLDRDTGERVLKLLLKSVQDYGATLIIITHDESIAARMDRIFEIKNKTVYERV
jgi:putative ABC transport system ATP-binding protein